MTIHAELVSKLEQENKTQAAIIAAQAAEIERMRKDMGMGAQVSKDTHTCGQYGDNCQAHNLHCGWPDCAVARTTPLDI